MLARVAALLVWALVAGTAAFWALRLSARSLPVPPQAALAQAAAPAAASWSRLLGAEPVAPAAAEAPPPPPESARFQLLGLAAPRGAGQGGVALIAVDGKPARAFRSGAAVDGDLVVQSLQLRSVALGPRGGAPRLTLELPMMPPPATGKPGGATAAVGAAAVPVAAPDGVAATAGQAVGALPGHLPTGGRYRGQADAIRAAAGQVPPAEGAGPAQPTPGAGPVPRPPQ